MRRVGTKSIPSGPQLTVRAGYGALRMVEAPAERPPMPGAAAHKGGRGLLDHARVALLPTPVSTLGRSLENTVVVLDPTASRHHARLKRTAAGWLIENIAPRNPLWVDGLEVAPGERLLVMPGAVLRLGATSLQLLAPLALQTSSQAHTRADDRSDQGDTLLLEGTYKGTSAPGTYHQTDGGNFDATRGIRELEDSQDMDSQDMLEMQDSEALSGMPGLSGLSTPWLMGRTHTRILSPGVTLTYALKGRLPPRVEWALALAALLLFVVSAILTLGVTTLVGQNALASEGLGHVLAALTIPLIPALGVSVVVYLLDRYEREPIPMLLAAFLWGAVIAIPPVLAVERSLGALALRALPTGGLGAALARAGAQAFNAGLTEELVKGAGLLLLLVILRDEFDNVTDGALYGALIGAGFAMVENFVYFAVSPRADLGVLIFGRVVLGWLSHSTFTALFGVSLGYLREKRSHRFRLLIPAAGLVAAIALHTLFDFVALGADAFASQRTVTVMGAVFALGVLVAEYGPLFCAQAALLRVVLAALRREAETVRTFLAPEVLSGVVTPEEYILAQQASKRDQVEQAYLLTYGPRAYLITRALFQAATGLAFRKWHVAEGDPPKPTPRQPEDAYRARIARLRRSLRREVSERESAHLLANSRAALPTRPL